MKLIHTSDIHIDSPLTARLSSSAARERKREIISSFRNIIDDARRIGAAGIIVAGDLFDNDRVKISCTTTIGKVNDEIVADISGPMVEIGFNCKYLLEALKASESDKVKLMINGGLSPMKIVPLGEESYIFLVLPVRLKGE